MKMLNMKLIDANKLFQETEENMHNNPHSDPIHAAMHKCEIDKQPEIDLVHFAGGCYCRECFHSEPVEYKDNKGLVTLMDEYWCNKYKDTMPLNGFCSEGRIDSNVTQEN